ncbi:neprilysin-4 [Anopheles gambiae]|nr:neprilysin-4 [Anopheles coluzzii]XP_040224207.2 neprilysin-4 [Anopheles coluzzii]XP_061501026.1 neprilysin-4 [Anopheles gambiae]XP_061501027.1 neprilysin-4 [Anopheles gambiae]
MRCSASSSCLRGAMELGADKPANKHDKGSLSVTAASSPAPNCGEDGGGGSGGGGGCTLGIDERTGRLQWCPGYRFVKFLFVIPAAMLPIGLLFLLLSRFQVVGSVSLAGDGHQLTEPSTTTDDLEGCGEFGYYYTEEHLTTNNNHLTEEIDWAEQTADDVERRCEPIPEKGPSESLDTDDRGLLRGIVRTSFIPSERRVLPADCLGEQAQPSTATEKAVERSEQLPRVRRSVGWMNDDRSSPESVRAAQVAIMKQYMDPDADPCDDFYQYACGNWDRVNPIPKDKAALDTFELLRESLDLVLKQLLLEGEPAGLLDVENALSTVRSQPDGTKKSTSTTTTAASAGWPTTTVTGGPAQQQLHRVRKRGRAENRNRSGRAVQNKLIIRSAQVKRVRRKRELLINDDAEMKARHLFVSCMNYELIERRGLEPLRTLLHSLGGWPVLEPHTWDESSFDWLNLTAALRRYNNDVLIVEWVGPDIKNSDENIVQFDQTSLGLPTRDYYLQPGNRKYLEAYRQFMLEVIGLLDVPADTARQATDEMIEFETQLANITSTPEERNNVSTLYRKLMLDQLQEEVPQINWTHYLTIVTERPVNGSSFVVMFAMSYMRDLVELIDQTEPRIVANYLLWRFVRHRINNLDDRFLGAKQRFSNALFGRERNPPRWKNCVTQVNANMGMAVGAMFVRRYFDENSKRDTLTMTHELQDAFREILGRTGWIDMATRQLAEQKVNAMSLRIGYPDFILDPEQLSARYATLEIHPDRYFENTLNVLSHIRRTDQEKLGQPVNKTAWHTAPAVVNAYYSRNKNQIMFPAGILQPPFYHRHLPKAINYGGIGVVIGHELTHGFDDKGRLFDRDGNLYRWWSDRAIEEFHERAACLVEQYGRYRIAEVDVQLDGENTQGENIADNGGIKQAFLAYSKWLAAQTDRRVLEAETLPGLNVTRTQLFFLNFAQIWCGAMRPEATRNKLKTAVHSPGRFRVIGTLSNSEDFAREYHCPVGSTMNPPGKCSVW